MKGEKSFFSDDDVFFITGDQVKRIGIMTWKLGTNGEEIRAVLRGVIKQEIPIPKKGKEYSANDFLPSEQKPVSEIIEGS
jgi:hypothetical protein